MVRDGVYVNVRCGVAGSARGRQYESAIAWDALHRTFGSGVIIRRINLSIPDDIFQVPIHIPCFYEWFRSMNKASDHWINAPFGSNIFPNPLGCEIHGRPNPQMACDPLGSQRK